MIMNDECYCQYEGNPEEAEKCNYCGGKLKNMDICDKIERLLHRDGITNVKTFYDDYDRIRVEFTKITDNWFNIPVGEIQRLFTKGELCYVKTGKESLDIIICKRDERFIEEDNEINVDYDDNDDNGERNE